ncbi:YcxB family protein [Streptomyces sp. NPDC091215]|uniref:YcxB family protein n=1 Tax=Streptomyces sp. NPDC091215 TaxID=3155192 RepID=UPI0034132429
MTQPTLQLRYVLEFDDLLELLARAPALRRLRNRAIRNAVTVLVLLWGSLIWVATVGPRWTTWVPAVFLALVFTRYARRALAFSSPWTIRRQARRIWRRSPKMQQEHDAEMGPQGLVIRTPGVISTYDWTQFSAFHETHRQFILLNESGKATIQIPKHALSSPALVADCRDLLTHYLTDASPPNPAATLTDTPPPTPSRFKR